MRLAAPTQVELLGPDRATFLNRMCTNKIETNLAGHRVSLCCLKSDGPATFLVSCDAEVVEDVARRLQEGGVRPCGAEALRIEAGRPAYGRDFGDENFPQELARDDRTISFTKGCYLGQETVARIASHGHVNKILVGLRFETAQTVAPGTELTFAGQQAGHVTSATFSPRFGTTLALGLQCPAGIAAESIASPWNARLLRLQLQAQGGRHWQDASGTRPVAPGGD